MMYIRLFANKLRQTKTFESERDIKFLLDCR